MNAVRMLEISSKRSLLPKILFDIFSNLRRFNISLEVKWLPCGDPRMVIQDYYSRDLDTTDYGISNEAFDAISKAWGPFTVDALRVTPTRE